jgi:hypothetical protein
MGKEKVRVAGNNEEKIKKGKVLFLDVLRSFSEH